MQSQNLHIHEDLLHVTLVNSRGEARRIMAVWLESQPVVAHRPQLVVLALGLDGTFLKINLPDTDWDAQP
jgi:hypothetical protein